MGEALAGASSYIGRPKPLDYKPIERASGCIQRGVARAGYTIRKQCFRATFARPLRFSISIHSLVLCILTRRLSHELGCIVMISLCVTSL